MKLEKEERNELIRIVVCIALLAALIVAEHTGAVPEGTPHLVLNTCYVVLFLISGFDVIKGAVLNVIHLEMLDEEFLMTVASAGAFVTGRFEEAAAVMLFYELGEWFEDLALDRSRDSIKDLLDIAPARANRVGEDGSVETVDPELIRPGDTLVVKPGEKVPVDGVVTKGDSYVDTSALTGEPVPRHVAEGDPIISGSVNGDSAVTMKAEKEYDASTVARIIELVENASEKKSKAENFITKFAKVYTPAVVASAVLLAVLPPVLGMGDLYTWLYRACTFPVISCPCAIVISVPLSFFGGIGAASRIGVLVKGSDYLERLSGIRCLVTDKTGTLTKGEFTVSKVYAAEGRTEEDVLRLAAEAESLSAHPIAKSILAAYGGEIKAVAAEDYDNVSGKGVVVKLDGKEVLAGSVRLLEEKGAKVPETLAGGVSLTYAMAAGTAVHIAEDGAYAGTIIISDTIKETSAQAVEELRKEGVEHVVMLTGDRKETAEKIAEETGMDEVHAELLPENKVEKLDEIAKDSGGRLAFAGDGINDAPSLMRADVGIAMGSLGVDAAIEAADVVIMDDEPIRIPQAMRIAKKTVRIAKENIVFALGIKFLILILGALGMASMWAAVFADVGVTVLCVLNAMRMLVQRKES